MPKRGSDLGACAPAPSSAPTPWQMAVKKVADQIFTDVDNTGLLLPEPMREMGNASEIAFDRPDRIAAIRQVLNVSVCATAKC
jgi:hypothetical protein